MDLVLGGACDTRSLLDGLRHPDRALDWMSRVDLGQMTWCEPSTLVGLAAFVEAEIGRGQYVRVDSPASRKVASYLARMRLGQVLTSLGADHQLPVIEERDAVSLLELRIFNGSRGAEQLARLVDQEVRSHEVAVAEGLWEGICETGQNVEQHSGRRFGFVAAQTYRGSRTSPRRRFLFAVGDSGRGIEASLAAARPRDSADALRMALRRGFSESGDPARGAGLPEINDHLRRLQGGLDVVSGNAGLRTHAPRRKEWHGPLAYPGTVVQGEIQR